MEYSMSTPWIGMKPEKLKSSLIYMIVKIGGGGFFSAFF